MSIIKEIDKENNKEENDKLENKVRKAFYKAQLYGQDKNWFTIVKSLVLTLFESIFLLAGFLPYCYDLSKRLSVILCVSLIEVELSPLRVE